MRQFLREAWLSWFSQLLTQLMQLQKESLKKSGFPGFEPWPLRYRCSALTNWANKPTGSWSLNWFVIYPGKTKMKLWINEIHIFELRNEELNVKKILAVTRIFFTFNSSFRSSNIWISFIHNFILILLSTRLNTVLNREIDSQHWKRHRRKRTREFHLHSPSTQPRSQKHHFKEL